MKLKNRMIFYRIITIVLGIVLLLAGILSTGYNPLLAMGIAMITVAIIQSIKTFRLLKNKELFEAYENRNTDERTIFIAQKSYSLAFWISVYSEFIAIIVLNFIGQEFYAVIFSYIVCAQILLYTVIFLIYNKRY